MDSSLPIGLFDSGVGGLTVFKALHELLPHEDLLYLGDTARVPYGTRSRETIARYTLMAAQKLVDGGIKMLVIACNTATAAALPLVRQKFAPLPVLGVIEPGAESACAMTRNRHLLVTGTEATIRGQAYQEAIGRILPDAKVEARACPLLVPLAEEGWLEGEATEAILKRYLSVFFQKNAARPDTILLGCTHFPLFRKAIARLAGPGVRIVDSATATASAARAELEKRNLRKQTTAVVRQVFLTTDNAERFARSGSLFLDRTLDVGEIELVDL